MLWVVLGVVLFTGFMVLLRPGTASFVAARSRMQRSVPVSTTGGDNSMIRCPFASVEAPKRNVFETCLAADDQPLHCYEVYQDNGTARQKVSTIGAPVT